MLLELMVVAAGATLAGYTLRRAEESAEREARRRRKSLHSATGTDDGESKTGLPVPRRTHSDYLHGVYSEATEASQAEPEPEEYLWQPSAEEAAAGVSVAALNPDSGAYLPTEPIVRAPWKRPVAPKRRAAARAGPVLGEAGVVLSEWCLDEEEAAELRAELKERRRQRRKARTAKEERRQERLRRHNRDTERSANISCKT